MGATRSKPSDATKHSDGVIGRVRPMALPVPVVGMTEASAYTACMLGGRFGMLVFAGATLPIYRGVIEGYGLGGFFGSLIGALVVLKDDAGAHFDLGDDGEKGGVQVLGGR